MGATYCKQEAQYDANRLKRAVDALKTFDPNTMISDKEAQNIYDVELKQKPLENEAYQRDQQMEKYNKLCNKLIEAGRYYITYYDKLNITHDCDINKCKWNIGDITKVIHFILYHPES